MSEWGLFPSTEQNSQLDEVYKQKTHQNFLGGHGGEGTPDPIPNSVVKLSIADDTAVFIVGK